MDDPRGNEFDDLSRLETIVEAARMWRQLDHEGRVIKTVEVAPTEEGRAFVTRFKSLRHWECGLAGAWTYTGDLEALRRWWLGRNRPGSDDIYEYRLPQDKGGHWAVNLQFHTARGRQRKFNFHLTVPPFSSNGS